MLLLDRRECLRPCQQVLVVRDRADTRPRLRRLTLPPVCDLRAQRRDLGAVAAAVPIEGRAGDARLSGVVPAPVPTAGAVGVRARRLVVLTAGEPGELADAILERRLVVLDGGDLGVRVGDLRLEEDESGLARILLRGGVRQGQLVRDRGLEDELHHRQSEDESEHQREQRTRDGRQSGSPAGSCRSSCRSGGRRCR